MMLTKIVNGQVVELSPEDEADIRAEWGRNAPTTEGIEAARIAGIKAAARSVILARYPEWKQANMTARAVELLKVQVTSALSPRDAAEFESLESAWDWVKQVRSASDAAEAAGLAPDAIAWPK